MIGVVARTTEDNCCNRETKCKHDWWESSLRRHIEKMLGGRDLIVHTTATHTWERMIKTHYIGWNKNRICGCVFVMSWIITFVDDKNDVVLTTQQSWDVVPGCFPAQRRIIVEWMGMRWCTVLTKKEKQTLLEVSEIHEKIEMILMTICCVLQTR